MHLVKDDESNKKVRNLITLIQAGAVAENE